MVACVMIRSGHSFRYPSTVLNYWKPRPSYVAPSQPEVLVPEDDDQEVEEELVFNPDELKNIKRRILWSLKKLGQNSFYGKESLKKYHFIKMTQTIPFLQVKKEAVNS